MFYFDNAATSWPKPSSVITEAVNATLKVGANANRSGYSMAKDAGAKILTARKRLCSLFNTSDPFEYAFTMNTTYALNFAIKGLLKPGSHVVTTSLEHNSVLRPLFGLKKSGVECDIIDCNEEGIIDPRRIERAIKPSTSLIIMTCCSNVLGTVQPVSEVTDIAHKHGIPILLDAAQAAGHIPFSIGNADMVAFPGHKGLYGLQGTGVLYVKKGVELSPIIEGGTGSESKVLAQPNVMPDKLEAGTQNMPAIAALGEAVRFVLSVDVERIARHEGQLATYFYNALKSIDSITLYGPQDRACCSGIVALNVGDHDPATVEDLLDKKYGIAVRSGFHCAPLAHKSIGTYDRGAVRFSFGFYNDEKQVDYAVKALREIAKSL